jgi:hypothetical protein
MHGISVGTFTSNMVLRPFTVMECAAEVASSVLRVTSGGEPSVTPRLPVSGAARLSSSFAGSIRGFALRFDRRERSHGREFPVRARLTAMEINDA